MNNTETQISKFLSLVLRHKPETIGLQLDPNGWADVNDLLEKSNSHGMKFNKDTLIHIVETNPKKRFAFNDGLDKIRAVQGHSIDIELGYTNQKPPEILYHGTGKKSVQSILDTGLEKRKRQHVHLSSDIDTAVKVGRRHGEPFVFRVHAEKMYNDKFEFFLADNGVWLTETVPVQYLEKAEHGGVSEIENDVQDKNSVAWLELCAYVEKVAEEKAEEFSPLEALGDELFSQIYTLPETISKLKSVKKIWLYGSSLKRIPPEIGEMESLEYFDPYTSYDLHWFPYEITNCKKLKDSRVSTRALFGNYKFRMGFPSLERNLVRYTGQTVKCSVCKKEISYEETNQLWISLNVGTDVLPLLANLCSKECERRLPKPPEGYLQYPHKGGAELKQPSYEEWAKSNVRVYTNKELKKFRKDAKPKLYNVIKKIWNE